MINSRMSDHHLFQYKIEKYSEIYKTIELTQVFIPETLITTFIITLVAAFGGAVGAQYFLRWSARRDKLDEEIQNIRFSIALFFEIADASINFKAQYIRSLCDNYKKSRHNFLLVQNKKFKQPKEVVISLDFRKFNQIDSINSYDLLGELAKIKVDSMALVAARRADRCLASFNATINHRNRFIDEWKKIEGEMSEDEKIRKYFGLKEEDVGSDENYKDYMSSLESSNNDCIYLSILVCRALEKRRKEIISQTRQNIEPAALDFSAAKADNLIPASNEYPQWEEWRLKSGIGEVG